MAKRRKKIKAALPIWLVIIIIIVIIAAYYCYAKGYIKFPDNTIESSDDSSGGQSETSSEGQSETSSGGQSETSSGGQSSGGSGAGDEQGEDSSFNDAPAPGNGNLNIYFLDVGQGDCMFIVFPDGKTMIIDSGDNKSYVREKISSAANKLNITTFDYLLLTHSDSDHSGSMKYVFDNFEIKKVFRPNVHSTYKDVSNLNPGINPEAVEGGKVQSSATYYNFLYSVQAEEGCEEEIFNYESDFTGTYSLGDISLDYTFDFLTPTAEKNQIAYSDANDYSPIVNLSYNGINIFLTGDAEKTAEAEFLRAYGAKFDIDVLKVGHHGSMTSTSQAFIDAVKPEYSVICCGTGNKYMHPRQSLLDRLKAANNKVFRTDTNGDIVLSVSAEEDYKISVERFYVEKSDMSKNFIGGDVVAE